MAKFNPANHPIPDTISAAPYSGADPVEMKKIDVKLYGNGKKTRNSADITYCVCPEKCSLYALGKCMQHRKLFGTDDVCHFGHVVTMQGFTQRAASFYAFKNHVKGDPCYSKTDGDSSFYLAKIDDTYIVSLPATNIERDEDTGKWVFKDTGWINSPAWIPEDEFDIEFVERIVNNRPRNIFGEIIRFYKEKDVPKFLENMKRVAPELYAGFVEKNPEYAEVKRDNVGRFAYVATLAEGTVLKLSGNTWVKKGKQLVGEDIKFDYGFLPLGHAAKVVLDIDENAKIKVEDNAWCNENTRFTNM